MAGLLDITGALGPAVAQAGKTYREFGSELALERHRGEQLAISQADLALREEAGRQEQRRVDIAEEAATLAKQKSDREEAAYQEGQQHLAVENYFPILGFGPNMSQVAIEKMNKYGVNEPVEGGRPGLRFKNLNPLMMQISKSAQDSLDLEIAKVMDLQIQIEALQQQRAKQLEKTGAPDPQAEEKLMGLLATQSRSNAAITQLKAMLKKEAAQKTSAVTETGLFVEAQQPGPEGAVARGALKDIEASKIRIGKERKDYTELGLAQRKDLMRYKSNLSTAAKQAGLKPTDQLILKLMTVGEENMTPQELDAWNKVKETDVKQAAQIARILATNMQFQVADPADAVQMYIQAKKRATSVSGADLRKKQTAAGKANPVPIDIVREIRNTPEMLALEKKDPQAFRKAVEAEILNRGYTIPE